MDELPIYIRTAVRPCKEGNQTGEKGDKQVARVAQYNSVLKNNLLEKRWQMISGNRLTVSYTHAVMCSLAELSLQRPC
jgi:hypothetical protein